MCVGKVSEMGFIKFENGTVATTSTDEIGQMLDVSGRLDVVESRVQDWHESFVSSYTPAFVHIMMISAGGGEVGSGFFVSGCDEEGYDHIMTNHHVIHSDEDATFDLYVMFGGGKLLRLAQDVHGASMPDADCVRMYSVKQDVAILRILAEDDGRVRLPLGSAPSLGEEVGVIGWTQGFDEQNVTFTRVKCLSFDTNTVTSDELPPGSMLCDSVTMAGGNSGGPWINRNGEVVGITAFGWGRYADEFGNSFDAFGVHIPSVILTKVGVFEGKRISTLSVDGATVSASHVLPLRPWDAALMGLNHFAGYMLYDSDGVLAHSAAITHVGGDEVGTLNHQGSLPALVFYADSSSLDVSLSDGTSGTLTLV